MGEYEAHDVTHTGESHSRCSSRFRKLSLITLSSAAKTGCGDTPEILALQNTPQKKMVLVLARLIQPVSEGSGDKNCATALA